MEHCKHCDEVIFFYKGFWVHGTDHVAVPASQADFVLETETEEDPDE